MSVLSRQDVHLTDYLRVLAKRWLFLAVVLAAALGGAAWQTSRQLPIYLATGRLMIDNIGTLVEFPGVTRWSGAALGNEIHIIKSREVAEHAVLTKLAPDLKRTEPAFESFVRKLRRSTSVETVPSSMIVEIRMTTDSPEKAERWCTALAESYIELNFEWRKQLNAAGSAAIRDEIEQNQVQLARAERNLMAFAAAHNMIEDWQKRVAREKQFGGSTEAKIEASRAAIEFANKYRALKQWYDENQYELPLQEHLAPSPLVRNLYTSIVEKKTELKNLRTRYREAHPRVQEVKAELATLEANLDDQIQVHLEALRKSAEMYAKIGEAHDDQIEAERKQSLLEAERQFQAAVLQRDVDVKSQVNLTLMAKLQELNVADSIVRNNVRIIERARSLPWPIRPNWRFNMLVGLVFGLAVAVAGVFFLEYLDNTLKTPDDIAKYLELPVLAVIPIARKELLRSPYEAPQLSEGEATSEGASAA